MLDYRYLRAFMAAAAHLNFGKAAKELCISPSALSRQIALLEQSCGSELFIRNTRQVTLTTSGKRLAGSARKFEQELTTASEASPLRIGCLQSVFEFFLVDLMERHPEHFDGPIDVTIGGPNTLRELTTSGDLDLAITNMKPPPSSTLSGFRLFRESISWIGKEKEEGAPNRVIVFSAVDHAYLPNEKNAGNRIRVNSFNAAVAMARHNVGSALVALPSQRKSSKHLVAASQWIYAVMPNYQRAPRRLEKLASLLKRKAI